MVAEWTSRSRLSAGLRLSRRRWNLSPTADAWWQWESLRAAPRRLWKLRVWFVAACESWGPTARARAQTCPKSCASRLAEFSEPRLSLHGASYWLTRIQPIKLSIAEKLSEGRL